MLKEPGGSEEPSLTNEPTDNLPEDIKPVDNLPVDVSTLDIPVPVKENHLEKTQEVVLTEEQQKGLEKITNEIYALDFKRARGIANDLVLPEEAVQRAGIEAIIRSSHRRSFYVPEIKDWLGLDPSRFQQIATKIIASHISNGDIYNAQKIKDVLHLSEEVFISPEVQQAAREVMIKQLSKENIEDALEIKDKFSLSGDVLKFPEVQQIAKEIIVRRLLDNYDIGNVLEIQNKLGLSKEIFNTPEVQQILKERIIKNLASGGLVNIQEILDICSLPNDILSTPEFQNMADNGAISYISSYDNANPEVLTKVRDGLQMPEGTVQWAANEAMIDSVANCNLDKALDIKKIFSMSDEALSSSDIKEAALSALYKHLSYVNGGVDDKDDDDLYNADRLRDVFNFSEETFKTVAKEVSMTDLDKGNIAGFIIIQTKFGNVVTNSEILNRFSDFKKIVEDIDKISNGFVGQVEKSQDLLLSLLHFREKPEILLQNIEQSPFLASAITENPQMGSRLLIKFPEFDETAKEDIAAIFQIKNGGRIAGLADKGFERLSDKNLDILNKIELLKPDIDPESVEFRILAQEQLMGFRNNRSIYEAGVANGVNMEQWLSYDKEVDFELGEKEPVPFTEMVKTPILRMQETLEDYQTQFKSILGQFRGELAGFKISAEDVEELKKQILEKDAELKKAEEVSRTEDTKLSEKERTDLEKKVRGIPKAIAGLQARIENPKMVTLWDKIIGTYESVVALQKDLFKINDKIAKAEKEELEIGGNKEMPARERRSALQKVKAGKEKMQQEFKEKLEAMNGRLENFRTTLPTLVGSCLGEERATTLLQEIQEQTGENFNHYETDKSTLENILKDDDKKEKLDGRSMNLGVWNRNPDIDLYLGNYTACCICIDSEYHGAESPIADYITDVGMQVIKVTDQKTGKPVVAAWCYIGVDDKGEKALVIDNIEADTKYSIPYRNQLEKEIKTYVGNYAKACNLTVSQGPDNNDLKVAKYEQKYNKLGGYNRMSGYYLEAEPDKEEENEE